MAFEAIKDRDAWSTIRGFVYQVDITILRWLQLQENQVLELEKGEDVDIITKGIGSTELRRGLEQVKYRESNLTINTDFVFEGFLNFFEHRKNNPKQHLLFRFVTNSSPSIERPSIFPEGHGAIAVWIQLQSEAKIDEKDERLIKIRNHLVRKADEMIIGTEATPLTKEQELAKEFKSFIGVPKNLISFIKDFEWSTKNPDDKEIGKTVRKFLLDFNFVVEPTGAELLHNRLFYFVFKLLSTKGVKLLDKAVLDQQVVLPDLSEADRQIFNVIEELLSPLEERVKSLEVGLDVTKSQIVNLVNDVNLIRESDSVFEYGLSRLFLNPPLPVENGASRSNKVNALLEELRKKNWIHICGINGTGKTQLAVLLSGHFNNNAWIDLRSYNTSPDKASLFIQDCIEKFSKIPFTGDTENWLELALGNLPEQTLIVINDLPRLGDGYRLNDLLILVFRKLRRAKIISTSNFSFPVIIKQHIEEKLFHEYDNLSFDVDEVREFLTNNSAPDVIVNRADLITTVSSGNARIVASIIQHLKSIGWATSSGKFIEAIFEKEFTKEFLEDVENSIKKYIVDESSRQLLYRLSFLHWTFNNPTVKAIAELKSEILLPKEKLLDLLNIWIQKTNDGYLLSPLAHDIGQDNLSSALIEQIHLTIAQTIIKSKTLNQITASRCITSFLKGKDYNNAGLIYISVLQSVESDYEIELLNEWGYLHYWGSTEIPVEMSIIIRAYIRHEQIKLQDKLGEDRSAYFESLKSYRNEGLSRSEHFFVTTFILLSWKDDVLDLYWSYLNYIFDEIDHIEEPFTSVIRKETIQIFIWLPVLRIRLKEDIEEWLLSIDRLRSLTSKDILEQDEFERAVFIIFQKKFDWERKQQSANWTDVLDSLTVFKNYFNKHANNKLEALVSTFLVKVQFQLDKDVSTAESLTIELASECTSTEAHYYLYDTLGKLYFDYDKAKSAHWLLKALDTNYKPKTFFLETLVFAASAISVANTEKPIILLEEALDLVISSDEFDGLDQIQILGELGIAYWNNTNYEQAFKCFEQTVTKLLESKSTPPDTRWIRYFTLAGHSLGYIAPSVASEQIREFMNDGEIYVKPYQGLFAFNDKDLSDLFFEKNVPLIMVYLAKFAEGIDRREKSYEWSFKAFDLARKNNDQKILLMITGICGQYSLINFKIEEAFESYLLFAAVSTFFPGDAKAKHEALGTINLADLFNSKPSTSWNIAEDIAVSFAITPMLIMVIVAHLENKPNAIENENKFMKLLNDYRSTASDQLMWVTLKDLCSNVLHKRISIQDLHAMGNKFAQQEMKNLQIICNLGILYVSKKYEERLFQLINTIPYLVKLNNQWRSVIKYVIVPFVKSISVEIIQEGFVGNKSELNELLDSISAIDIQNKNAPQLILQPVVQEIGIALSDDRKRWLFNFDDI